MTESRRLSLAFVGLTCTDVSCFDTKAWCFEFGGRTKLYVYGPWRIVADSKIALGYADHRQEFGLGKPVDGITAAKELLARPIVAVHVEDCTADLEVQLQSSISLQVFNSSCCYKGWECLSDDGTVAIGGAAGELEVFPTP